MFVDHLQHVDLATGYYPNRIGRLILLSLEDVVGRQSLAALLQRAGVGHLVNRYPPNDLRREFAFADLAAIMATVQQVYGERGSHGMTRRAGRGTYQLGANEFASLMALDERRLLRLALPDRLRLVLRSTAQLFDRVSDQSTSVEERDGQLFFVIERCPVCWGRQLKQPDCGFMEGLIQEIVGTLTGGHKYTFNEIECLGTGGEACVWEIDPLPHDRP